MPDKSKIEVSPSPVAISCSVLTNTAYTRLTQRESKIGHMNWRTEETTEEICLKMFIGDLLILVYILI